MRVRRIDAGGVRATLAVILALLAVVAAGCGDDDDGNSSTAAVYAGRGPYAVGVTQRSLSDRLVEVWYPAQRAGTRGVAPAVYDNRDPLPPPLLALLPPDLELPYEMTSYRDVPASTDGPFPVLLFSHGFGGWRLVNSTLLEGIASWGFVVASPDHLERGLASVAGFPPASRRADDEVLLDVLALLEQENAVGPLAGRIDSTHVAVSGHSAGGAAALSMLDESAIDAVVGYAAAGAPPAGAPAKPTLLVVAAGDLIVTPAGTRSIYTALPSPKRFVVIEQTGHNSFSDICAVILAGNDIVGLVRMLGFPIPDNLLVLAENGCEPGNLAPPDAWAVIQHFTVAHLRVAFDFERQPVGLAPGVADAFPGITVTYEQE